MREAKEDPSTAPRVVVLATLLVMLVGGRGLADDPPELAGFVKDFRSAEAVKKRKAAKSIGELGPAAKSAAPALANVLQRDRDSLTRQNAAEALGQINGEGRTAIPALARAMKDEDREVMSAAALALAKYGKAAVPTLKKALADDDNLVRKNAAEAIAKIGPEAKDAVDDLVNALKNEKPAMRRRDNSFKASYVEALGAIGPSAKSAVKYLEESIAARNVDREYRRVVTEALRKIKKSS